MWEELRKSHVPFDLSVCRSRSPAKACHSHEETEREKHRDSHKDSHKDSLRRRSNEEVQYSPRKLPVGLKGVIRKKVDDAIQQTNQRLQELMTIIREVQRECPSQWEVVTVEPLQAPVTGGDPRLEQNDFSPRHVLGRDPRPDNAAVRDAFDIVKLLLSEMTILVNEISSHTADNDFSMMDVDSPDLSYFYAQYVFQVTYFMFKIVCERIQKFSQTLREASLEEFKKSVGTFDRVDSLSVKVKTLRRKKDLLCQKVGCCECTDGKGGLQSSPSPADQSSADASFDCCSEDAFSRRDEIGSSSSSVRQAGQASSAVGSPSAFRPSRSASPSPSARQEEQASGQPRGEVDALRDLSEVDAGNQEASSTLDLLSFLSERMLQWLRDSGVAGRQGALQKTVKMPHVCDDCRRNYFPGAKQRADAAADTTGTSPDDEGSRHLQLTPFSRDTSNADDRALAWMKPQSSSSSAPPPPQHQHQAHSDDHQIRSHHHHHLTDFLLKPPAVLGGTSANPIFSQRSPPQIQGRSPSQNQGLMFDSKLFADLLKDEFRTNILDQGKKDGAQDNSTEILNAVILSFRKASSGSPPTSIENPLLASNISKPGRTQDFGVSPVAPQKPFQTIPPAAPKEVKRKNKFEPHSDERCTSLQGFLKKEEQQKSKTETPPKVPEKPAKVPEKPAKVPEKPAKVSPPPSKQVATTKEMPLKISSFADSQTSSKKTKEKNPHVLVALHSHHDSLPEDSVEIRAVDIDGKVMVFLEDNVGCCKADCLQCETKAQGKSESDEALIETIERRMSNIDIRFMKKKKIDLHPRHSHWRLAKAEPERTGAVVKWLSFHKQVKKQGYLSGPPLVLRIRNGHYVTDAFDTLMIRSGIPLNHYRCLHVDFNDDPTFSEKDLNQSIGDEGQTEQLFGMLSEHLFSPRARQLFDYPSEKSEWLYPNPSSPSHIEWFSFAGVILALALLHGQPVGVELPLCFYKCLLDRPLGLPDVAEIDPELHARLRRLLDNPVDATARTTFTTTERVGNGFCECELLPDGATMLVTEQNKADYVARCLRWALAERCLEYLLALRKGFSEVLDPSLLTSFTERELQRLISRSAESSDSSPESSEEEDQENKEPDAKKY